MRAARFLQSRVRFLAKHPRMAKRTIRLLPGGLAAQVRHLVIAARKLTKLSGGKRRKLKTGEPPPLSELVGYYEKANRLYGIAAHYLAAIHHVETKFGRVKSHSVAGAKGPMQFIPSTWRIYGRGGNIQDPHDAILAAARLLRANGAPRSYGRALYAYNPSKLYVVAVTRYAKRIASDPYALHYLYSWEAYAARRAAGNWRSSEGSSGSSRLIVPCEGPSSRSRSGPQARPSSSRTEAGSVPTVTRRIASSAGQAGGRAGSGSSGASREAATSRVVSVTRRPPLSIPSQ